MKALVYTAPNEVTYRDEPEPAFGDGDVLYCDVKSATYRARFLRAAQSELLGHVTANGDGFVLPVPGGVQPLEHRGA